jgi:hypothetical protein
LRFVILSPKTLLFITQERIRQKKLLRKWYARHVKTDGYTDAHSIKSYFEIWKRLESQW